MVGPVDRSGFRTNERTSTSTRHPETKFSTQRLICPRVTKVREIATKNRRKDKGKRERIFAPQPLGTKDCLWAKRKQMWPMGKW